MRPESGTKIVMFPGWPRKLLVARQEWQEHYVECDECSIDHFCAEATELATELLAEADRMVQSPAPTLQKRRLR